MIDYDKIKEIMQDWADEIHCSLSYIVSDRYQMICIYTECPELVQLEREYRLKLAKICPYDVFVSKLTDTVYPDTVYPKTKM